LIKSDRPVLIVICGPTASGKTCLAVRASSDFTGEIISADSRQVYRGMDIGSGKDKNEYFYDNQQIVSHLIDIAQPNELYSLYRFVNDFNIAFNEIINKNKTPILAGGTGLYIEAIIKKYDLSPVPEVENFRKKMNNSNIDELIILLKENFTDIYYKTDLSSKKRIIRSLEIGYFGDDYLSEKLIYPDFDVKVFCTKWDRKDLINRINQRLDYRLKNGMIEEVSRLLDEGISPERLMSFGMEYKFITMYLKGSLLFDEMVDNLRTSIHRLSKRQMTYFRGMEKRGVEITWIENAEYSCLHEHLSKLF